MTTALADGEILVAIDVPVAGRGQGVGVPEVLAPRLALRRGRRGGAGDGPERHVHRGAGGGRRPAAARTARVGGRARADRQAREPETIAGGGTVAADDLGGDVTGDLFASAEYRTAMAPVYVKRALTAAVARAKGGS